MSPASAIAIRSAHAHREQRERDGRACRCRPRAPARPCRGCRRRSRSACRSARRRSPSSGARTWSCSSDTSSESLRRLRLLRLQQRDGVPVAREEHRHLALARRDGRARLHAVRLRQRLEELARTSAGRGPSRAGCRAGSAPGRAGNATARNVSASCAPPPLASAARALRGARRAMMAVRDVEHAAAARTRRRWPPRSEAGTRQIVCRTPSAAVKSYSGASAVTRAASASIAGDAVIRQEHRARSARAAPRCAASGRLPCPSASSRASG